MDFVPGAAIAGKYRLKQLVGAGGMGEVWAAEDIQKRSKVALKHLLPTAAKHHEVVARFKREAYLLGKLESPYVAKVRDFFDDETFGLVLVMDFIEGPSLASTLEERTLTIEEAIDLSVDLLCALSDLHGANIVHRDLKPGNIIMRPMPDGSTRAMVVDFGISRLIPSQGEEVTGITRANIALGTVEYMAPEQILNSRDVTAVTDLYAVGIILFRAVKGHHAFGERRGEDLARAKLIEDAPALTTSRKDELATGLIAMVARALKKKPSQRYPSAAEMLKVAKALQVRAQELAELEDTTTDGGRTAVKISPVALPVERPRPPNPRPAAGRPASASPEAPRASASSAAAPPAASSSPGSKAPDTVRADKPSNGAHAPEATRATAPKDEAPVAARAPRAPLSSVPEILPIGRAPAESRPAPRAPLPSFGDSVLPDFDARRSMPEINGLASAAAVQPAAPPAPPSTNERRGVVLPVGMLALGFVTTLAVGAVIGLAVAPRTPTDCEPAATAAPVPSENAAGECKPAATQAPVATATASADPADSFEIVETPTAAPTTKASAKASSKPATSSKPVSTALPTSSPTAAPTTTTTAAPTTTTPTAAPAPTGAPTAAPTATPAKPPVPPIDGG
jgi:serine/threonine protein kinase